MLRIGLKMWSNGPGGWRGTSSLKTTGIPYLATIHRRIDWNLGVASWVPIRCWDAHLTYTASANGLSRWMAHCYFWSQRRRFHQENICPGPFGEHSIDWELASLDVKTSWPDGDTVTSRTIYSIVVSYRLWSIFWNSVIWTPHVQWKIIF